MPTDKGRLSRIARLAIVFAALLVCNQPIARCQSLTSGSERRPSFSNDDYAKVNVFGVEGSGNKFVYVFDRSASMVGPPLAAAKRELLKSIEMLGDVHQFHIIFFNQRMQSFDITGGSQRISFATDRNKRLAARFVDGVKADGGSARFAALKQALAFRPDVVFFLSDADGPMSESEVADILRLNERIGAAICVIEFGSGDTAPKRNFLTELANENGGQYGYVNAAKLPN